MTGYIVAATLIALLALSLDVEAELAVHRAVRARVRVALGGVGLTLHIELRRQTADWWLRYGARAADVSMCARWVAAAVRPNSSSPRCARGRGD